MKKLISLLLILSVLLSTAFILPASAEGTEPWKDHIPQNGIDLVIVLDMTQSMTTGDDGGNDPLNYRLDAAAMLIGMLDMNGSRVAIIPFDGKPGDKPEDTVNRNFAEVKTTSVRQEKLEYIYGLSQKEQLGAQTNIGTALMLADKILFEREDDSNAPMIVLLTDGKNSLPPNSDTLYTGKGTGSLFFRWNEVEEFHEDPYEGYTSDSKKERVNQIGSMKDLDNVVKEATECAKAYGYPIYCIALAVDASTEANDHYSLSAISEYTDAGEEGVGWFNVTKDNAYRLPEFFAKTLSGMIGSSVKIDAKPELVQGTANTYEITVPILNRSVQEVNIILPVTGDDHKTIIVAPDSNIDVLNADGKVVSAGERTYVSHSKEGKFAFVKIREPHKEGNPGNWKIRFTTDGRTPTESSFNILYNYDIKLRVNASNGKDNEGFYKSDRLTFTADFIDTEGKRVADKALFEKHSKDDDPSTEWQDINVQWRLTATDGTAFEGFMERDPDHYCFKYELDLSEEKYSGLMAGDYTLKFSAEGAGLDRTVTEEVELKNHLPKALVGGTHKENINVNVPGNAATWDSSCVLGSKLNDLVTDEDGDPIEFTLRKKDSNADSPVELTISQNDGSIQCAFKGTGEYEGGKEKLRNGSSVWLLTYHDDDDSENIGTLEIEVNVISGVDKMLDDYSIVIQDSDGNTLNAPFGDIGKCARFEFTVLLKPNNSADQAAEKLATIADRAAVHLIMDGVDCSIDLNTKNPFGPDNEHQYAASLQREGDKLHFVLESTGVKSGTWDVNVSLPPFEDVKGTLTIKNDHAPELRNADMPAAGTIRYNGEMIPGFLSGLFKVTSPDDLRIDIQHNGTTNDSMFMDRDGEEPTVGAPKFYVDREWDAQSNSYVYDDTDDLFSPEVISAEPEDDSEPVTAYVIKADRAGAKPRVEAGKKPTAIGYLLDAVNVINLKPYQYAAYMVIDAKDGDGEIGRYEKEWTIVNLYDAMIVWGIRVAIVIIALVILILIVHQIRKPRFPKLSMGIHHDTTNFMAATTELSPVKQSRSIENCGVDESIAGRHGISQEQLQKIIIKPVRSSLEVGVVCKAILPNHEISIDGRPLEAKKQYAWRVEQEMSISNKGENGDGAVQIQLMKTDDNTVVNVGDNLWGNGDGWGELNTTNQNNRRSRRTHNVVRRGAPQNDDTFGNDPGDDVF